jgi:hypothetical protein
MKAFWNSVRKTVARPAEPLVLAQIPRPGNDVAIPEPDLREHEGYVRVWLCQMFLAKKSTLLANWVPAAHGHVTIGAAGRITHEYGRVMRPDPKEMAEGVRLNFALSDLVPYAGGDVEIEAALLGLQSGNHLDIVVDLLSLVSAIPVPGLDVAEKITTGARDLVTRSGGAVHLDLHQTFVAGGAGGAAVRSTYLAVVLAATSQVEPTNLRIVDDRLHQISNGRMMPLVGFDFMLLRLQCRPDRPDYWLPEVEEAWGKAVAAHRDGDRTAADGYQKAARAAALNTVLLTWPDRRRLIEAIATQWKLLEDAGRGLAPGEVATSATELMQRRAPDLEEALLRGRITAAEAFSR